MCLLVLLALLLTACATSMPVPPYLALITPILPGAPGLCTGFVVSPRQVVTAKHCVEDARRVVTANGQEAWVESYRTSDKHDVAVLRTDRVLWVKEFAKLGHPALGVPASIYGFCPYQISFVERHAVYSGLVTFERKDGALFDFGEWFVVGGKVCGGDSGLGVVQNGKVVGILSMVETDIFWIALGSQMYTVPPDYAAALLEVP